MPPLSPPPPPPPPPPPRPHLLHPMCVSQPAKDLVLKLLERDPTKRLSAEEALNHPWIALWSDEGGAATGDLSTAYELLKKQVVQKRCVEMRQFSALVHAAQFWYSHCAPCVSGVRRDVARPRDHERSGGRRRDDECETRLEAASADARGAGVERDGARNGAEGRVDGVDAADVAAPRRARHAAARGVEDGYGRRAAGHLQPVRPRRQRHDRRRRAGGADEEARLGHAPNPSPTRYSPLHRCL